MTEVFNSIFNTTSDGFDLTTASDGLKIDAGVLVSSSEAAGVLSSADGDTLDNFGLIVSGALGGFKDGVYFENDAGSITNEVGAVISGYFGVGVNGNHERINNFGSIYGFGLFGVYFDGSSEDVKLVNHGSIYGNAEGVRATSWLDGGTIINYGVINSGGIGVHACTAGGLVTTIVNGVGGIIAGVADAIKTQSSGSISLTNQGTLNGNVDFTVPGASSSVLNQGAINGDVIFEQATTPT
jgi:hypothetical protein